MRTYVGKCVRVCKCLDKFDTKKEKKCCTYEQETDEHFKHYSPLK